MHHWPFIERARKKGAKLIVVDPLESRTARRADWHVRPMPGTDAALALALICQIVSDDRIDRDYIARYTLGFDALSACQRVHASGCQRHYRREKGGHRQARRAVTRSKRTLINGSP
jgi:anaerobic selenocysteine-containing dehydrogenase